MNLCLLRVEDMGRARFFSDMHRAAADKGATTGAGT
jgi:hypothetical protein